MSLEHHRLNLGPLDNNTYVLACSETRTTAVLDVGFEPEAVIDFLRRGRFDVRLLLNTHAHYDHVAGMRAVQEAVGGAYYLHPADRPLLDRLSHQGAAFGFPPARAPDEVLDLTDGQSIPLGSESLQVLHTPGHSPGHVIFVHDGDAWVGDVLFAGSVGRTDLPGGSFEQLERSIRTRVFPLGDAVRVHTGHGPDTTVGAERLHNPFVGDRAGGFA
jgi:glyoxylase-like metal-dependent hydrolase (beta-lactamase superfamily II)